MKKRPAYVIESVDHALRLACLLQQHGPVRLTEAAEHLGVAHSTAHRLLAMLVYHDFARQDSARRYVPGPVLQPCGGSEPATRLRQLAPPHLAALSHRCRETVNIQVLIGDHVRFIASVEPEDQVLKVGNREGRMLPAHLTSGGRAILSRWPEHEVLDLYHLPNAAPVDLDRLVADLRQARRRGFAINDQATERGVSAVGRAIRSGDGPPSAALCIASPTARFSRERASELGHMLFTAVGDLERALAAAPDRPAGAREHAHDRGRHTASRS